MSRTQRERSAATTAELLVAARDLFAADGYAATLLDDVVRAAGVTKGALYHHFAGKKELFAAVFEAEQEKLAAHVLDAYRGEADAWDGFRVACEAFLEASLDPGFQRIALLDAPSVLGWDALREIESRYTIAQLREGLRVAMEQGRIAERPLEPLTRLLDGAMCEGAMLIARSEDPQRAMREVLAELRVMLSAL
jgi:AcrR family transcriptional regulator